MKIFSICDVVIMRGLNWGNVVWVKPRKKKICMGRNKGQEQRRDQVDLKIGKRS
jgi:hypothetical protein